MCGHDSCYVSAFRVFTYLKRENGKKVISSKVKIHVPQLKLNKTCVW